MTPDLSKGDFVYQSDLELFLVVVEETENSYKFAAHGWREIDKERLDEYLSHDNGKLHSQDDIIDYIDNEAGEELTEKFNRMRQMFMAYSEEELEEGFPHENFTLEDT